MSLYIPDPRLMASGLPLFDEVRAADFPQAILRYRNRRAAQSVGLDTLGDEAWVSHFGRFEPLSNNQARPLALRYHGHQFRHYNPDLGDGRGFLFAQMRDDHNRLLDLGTKGSGQTPWSRGGDGRLTLKGGVREVLATAMLEALGVPTSKSFSLIETGEALHRGDEPSPTRSSVLVRLSHSHIRFGTFERLAWLNDTATLEGLVRYVIDNFYTGLEGAADLFDAVVSKSARLAARWMAAGFVHGVLNTDNMNITGESFDYGPYRFLPIYDPNFTAAYFDHSGLYAYGRQPDAVAWNLARLGSCLTLICDSDPLVASLNGFSRRYDHELGLAVCARLNLVPQDDNGPLVKALLALLRDQVTDGSFDGVIYDVFRGALSDQNSAFADVLSTYAVADVARHNHPRLQEPKPETLLIDEIEAIWADIAQHDDWSRFYAKLEAIGAYREALNLAG